MFICIWTGFYSSYKEYVFIQKVNLGVTCYKLVLETKWKLLKKTGNRIELILITKKNFKKWNT